MPDLSAISSIPALEDALSAPSPQAIDALSRCPGDILLLGAGGKMGPTLARMAKRAAEQAGESRRVIAVSRFSSREARMGLEIAGVETIGGDLLDRGFLNALPDCPNVIFMTGMKFGATGNEGMTWAMNCYLPALACERFRASRIAVFSTGNVYGLVPVTTGGSRETDALAPVGEYAMSCVGRERMVQYSSERHGTACALLRLNYACELRYGVLVDIAQKVWNGETIDVSMGYVNVIWQGDANAMSLAALAHGSSPAAIFNIAGPEILSVRSVAQQFAAHFDKEAAIEGTEGPDALLNNGVAASELLGAPSVTATALIDGIAQWLRQGGEMLGKPTHFEERSGNF